jgi:large subunit ribosomal protein L10
MQTRAEKENEVKVLGESFAETQVALCADYRGLTVEQVTKLRKELRKAGAIGRVTKNTLARIAAEKAYKDADPEQLKKLLATFVGPSLFVFSKADPVSPARVLADFAKKVDKLKIRGGFFEGNFLSESGVKDLATMPSKEESQAQLLATMLAPATQLVRTLMEPAAQLVRLLEARRKQLEEKA